MEIILIWAFVVGVTTVTITGMDVKDESPETTKERFVTIPEIGSKSR